MQTPVMHTALGVAPAPTGEDESTARRRLCLGAMAAAPGLLRYAARFAPSMEDAEDAYQRSMEIALTRGPVVDQHEFVAWLHVVLRNEATSLARRRSVEAPADDQVVTATIDRATSTHNEPAAVMEWKERYRTLQDAMTTLSDAQRICLLLRTAGVSRAEIGSMTGYTDRQVERSIVRGRARLNAWHLDMASGEKCLGTRPALERVGDEEASAGDRRSVSRHVRHCAHCRATLRARRQSNAGLLVLVPVAIIATTAVAGVGVPDATAAMNVVDRGTARIAVSIGQAWNALLDIPSLMSARIGAGALAVTVAGVAGVPIVAHQLQGGQAAIAQQVTMSQPVQTSAAVVGPSPPASRVADAEDLLARLRAQTDRERRALAARRQAAQRKAAAEKAAPAAQVISSPAASPAPGSSSQNAPVSPGAQPQLEFGP